MKRLRLVQLPVPPPAALAATGNVPLAAGALGVSAQVHGLGSALTLDVVTPDITDTLGDTLLAEHLARDEPDFLGLSLYLWNTERSLHLAREVKRRSPRTQVLVGGPEVGADNPFLLAQQGFDVAVTGEAEDTFGALMGKLLAGEDPTGLPGVAVRGARGALSPFGPPPSANFPLTRFPSPYTRGLVPVDPARSTYLETVRGCRSSCTFCFYPRSSNVLRVLDVAQSAALVAAVKEQGAREVVFLDPTFNHRPEFEALLEALAEVNADRALSFFAEVRAEGLTAQHAEALARAGFTKLELGLQSVNPLTLKRVKRGGSPAKVAGAAKLLHDVGIELLVDLIVGLPGDSEDDVLRGIDFLEEHGLGDEAQVFALSLLPGTAMRSTALADGVVYDAAPPYRVLRTATLSTAQLQGLLQRAEQRLDRRLDELPRPHLVGTSAQPARPDVVRVDLEGPQVPAAPGSQHLALWFDAEDLFARRARLGAAIDARLAVDPYATLDVVLVARHPFPLDLLELVRARLEAGVPSYLSRALALRGENLQRRIAVVVPQGARLPPDWVAAVAAVVPLFEEQSAAQALREPAALGGPNPGARILGEVDAAQWAALVDGARPEAVAFEDRALEAKWLRAALG